jgi:hypothetical protein
MVSHGAGNACDSTSVERLPKREILNINFKCKLKLKHMYI